MNTLIEATVRHKQPTLITVITFCRQLAVCSQQRVRPIRCYGFKKRNTSVFGSRDDGSVSLSPHPPSPPSWSGWKQQKRLGDVTDYALQSPRWRGGGAQSFKGPSSSSPASASSSQVNTDSPDCRYLTQNRLQLKTNTRNYTTLCVTGYCRSLCSYLLQIIIGVTILNKNNVLLCSLAENAEQSLCVFVFSLHGP